MIFKSTNKKFRIFQTQQVSVKQSESERTKTRVNYKILNVDYIKSIQLTIVQNLLS